MAIIQNRSIGKLLLLNGASAGFTAISSPPAGVLKQRSSYNMTHQFQDQTPT
jgi:hypothetical protein